MVDFPIMHSVENKKSMLRLMCYYSFMGGRGPDHGKLLPVNDELICGNRVPHAL